MVAKVMYPERQAKQRRSGESGVMTRYSRRGSATRTNVTLAWHERIDNAYKVPATPAYAHPATVVLSRT